jgi:plastocyanin
MQASRRTAALCALALTATLATTAGCGHKQPGNTGEREVEATVTPRGTVLELTAPRSGSGAFRFDTRRLKAAPGPVTIRFNNRDTFPHNVRVQAGSKCCFEPDYRDVGGTQTISGGTKTEAALTLEPGRYVFLCSIGSHYDGDSGRMRGRLTIRANQG